MTNEEFYEPRIPKPLSFPLSIFASLILLVAAAMLVYSLVNALFVTGRDSMLWAIFGFWALAALTVYTEICHPHPLVRLWRGFSTLADFFAIGGKFLFVVAAISILAVCAAFPHGNVPPYDDLPVFARRSEYVLSRGSKGYLEVSRFRYLLAAAGFSVGWHCGALGAAFSLQYVLLSGIPKRKSSS